MFKRLPPHLTDTPWLDFEQDIATNVQEDLDYELRRLAEKQSAGRVHDTRVALRRWESIWTVLHEDGWESKKYWKIVGKPLRQLRQDLGDLRDFDVNLELGAEMKVPDDILDAWSRHQKKIKKQVRRDIEKIEIDSLLKYLKRFLKKRPAKLSRGKSEEQMTESAYDHLEAFLVLQERVTRELEAKARTKEQLHELRLSIKAWRYLLAEFFGLTNLELVRAQQLLGKLNDVERVVALLRDEKTGDPIAKRALSHLLIEREKLLEQFSRLRKALPYGLRPGISSL